MLSLKSKKESILKRIRMVIIGAASLLIVAGCEEQSASFKENHAFLENLTPYGDFYQPEEKGQGIVRGENEFGSTELGAPIMISYDPETFGHSFAIKTEAFNDQMKSFVFIDGKFFKTDVFSNSRVLISLESPTGVERSKMLKEGNHVLQILQFAEDNLDSAKTCHD